MAEPEAMVWLPDAHMQTRSTISSSQTQAFGSASTISLDGKSYLSPFFFSAWVQLIVGPTDANMETKSTFGYQAHTLPEGVYRISNTSYPSELYEGLKESYFPGK